MKICTQNLIKVVQHFLFIYIVSVDIMSKGALLENDYLNSLGHYLYSSIYAVTQTHEKISTLRQLDDRIEAMEEETTTNGVF
jgi:hypothetical protein